MRDLLTPAEWRILVLLLLGLIVMLLWRPR